MALSDKIIIMNKGVVAQMGTPQEIYYHPVDEFVADFIGEANFLKGKMTGKSGKYAVMNVEGSDVKVELGGHMEEGGEYTLVLRPEAATLADAGGMPCRVVLSCFMGSYQNYHVMVGNTLVKLEEHNPKNKRIRTNGSTRWERPARWCLNRNLFTSCKKIRAVRTKADGSGDFQIIHISQKCTIIDGLN